MGFLDFTKFEIPFNELLTFVHLLWIHRVGFGYLRNEGLLQVNSMVKGLSGREFSILWFIEHLGILSILWGEFVFNFFSGLGKGSGKCEL